MSMDIQMAWNTVNHPWKNATHKHIFTMKPPADDCCEALRDILDEDPLENLLLTDPLEALPPLP